MSEANERRYWLFKSEPDTYGYDRLEREGRTEWSGVRNFQARNLMKTMRAGELGFFYHSSTKVPGIAGIVRVAREAYPDFTARDRASDYFDPRATEANPIWEMVDVVPERRLPRFVTLAELRADAALAPTMVLLRRGSRLSVQPVHIREWEHILTLAETPAP
jgi:predicted RNA-binding protein with PUA-like domain